MSEYLGPFGSSDNGSMTFGVWGWADSVKRPEHETRRLPFRSIPAGIMRVSWDVWEVFAAHSAWQQTMN